MRNNPGKSRAGAAILAIALGAVLMIACRALARAGGGEGFSGGGGGDGGGGGGGGGGALWIIYYWLEFCVDYPWFGLPITAGVVVVIYLSHQRTLNGWQNSVIRRGNAVSGDNRSAEAMAAIVQSDPAFNPGLFFERVKTGFFKIQSAWCQQDLSQVRPFISDGIHERFSLQIQEQKDFGYHDQMDSLAVAGMEIVEVSADSFFDVVTVRIEASAVDRRMSIADGHRLSGSMLPRRFAEFWSFIRRHGVNSDPSRRGLIEGQCPNCGVAIEMNQSAQCSHCKALLRSGEFDWVLAEITQEGQWHPGRRGDEETAGITAIRQRDPSFNRVGLEDRASVIVWRKATADRTGSIDPLRKMAGEDFCTAYAAKIAPQTDRPRMFYGDCAVGAVHLIGVLPGEKTDQAVLQVAWEGEQMMTRPGQPITRTGQRSQVHNLYVLWRNVGVSSDPGRSVSSAHCPGCGAPMTTDVASGCSFCGAVLNDGAHGWLLGGIFSASSPDGQQLLFKLSGQGPPVVPVNGFGSAMAARLGGAVLSPAALLSWAIRTAVSDGQVDLRERQLLNALAARSSVTPAQLEMMIHMAERDQLDLPDPPDRATARTWLQAIAATVVCDGTVTPSEEEFLTAAGRRFGFGVPEVRQMLEEQRQARYVAARQELADARGRARDPTPPGSPN